MTDLAPLRFRIVDALVLTGAAALAIWIGRNVDHDFGPLRFVIHYWLQTFALVLTFALSALAILCPNARERISRSTGRLALVLVSIVILFSAICVWYFPIVYGSDWAVPPSLATRLSTYISVTLFDTDLHAPAYACIAAFATLRIQNTASFSRDWIDILGIWLGVFWVLRSLAMGFLYYYKELLLGG